MLFMKTKKKFFSAFAISIALMSTAYADFNFMENLKSPEMYFTPEAVEIYHAASRGDNAKIKRHIIEGTRIESKGPQNPGKSLHQITLLSYAVGMNNAKAIETLIASGANPTYMPTARQDNTFTFAIMRKNVEGLKLLFQYYPVNKLTDKEKSKHLFTSVGYGCYDCVDVLLKQGYDINTLNNKKENLFIEALHNQEWDIALWLLKDQKININVESIEGITPANAVQFYAFQQKPKSLAKDKLKEMEKFLTQTYNIRFPVLTRLQIQEKNSIVESIQAPKIPQGTTPKR